MPRMIIPGFALRHARTVASCAFSSVKSHISPNKATPRKGRVVPMLLTSSGGGCERPIDHRTRHEMNNHTTTKLDTDAQVSGEVLPARVLASTAGKNRSTSSWTTADGPRKSSVKTLVSERCMYWMTGQARCTNGGGTIDTKPASIAKKALAEEQALTKSQRSFQVVLTSEPRMVWNKEVVRKQLRKHGRS